MATCLVLIDLQKGFLEKEAVRFLPEKIVGLVCSRHFDHIVATQFQNTPDSVFHRFLGWDGMMDKNSQAIDSRILPLVERVFVKQGYTCFTEEFCNFIKTKGISYLFFAGVDTDACVLKTALDCFERGIPFSVLWEYCGSSGGERIEEAAYQILLRNIGRKQIGSFILGQTCDIIIT